VPRSALAVAVALLAACSPSEIPSADPPASDQAACRTLVAALPDTIDGEDNSGRSEYAASWGDPRIVMRCGVATPAAYEQTSELIVINDVSWLPEEQQRGYVFTAVGRTPQVEVYVPDAHQPEVNPLVDLAAPVQQYTKVSSVAGSAS
jgi:hypothetical protein